MNKARWKRLVGTALIGTALFVSLSANSGCGESAHDQSEHAAENLEGQIHQAKHNLEFRNYNLRQEIADNPATILWCTFFPPGVQGTSNGSTPGQAFTVPISGKLTSSGKRPYLDEPGPDHMYGSSVEYRYGFDPTLSIYQDFTNLPSYCTTEPTVWQAKQTTLVVQTDKTLSNLSKQAERATQANKPGDALKALQEGETASNKAQGR